MEEEAHAPPQEEEKKDEATVQVNGVYPSEIC